MTATTETTTAQPRTRVADAKAIARVLAANPTIGPFVALLLAGAFFTGESDRFLHLDNISLILQQVMVTGVLALGQTLVILTAGIDLSNGAVMAFGQIVMTHLAIHEGLPVFASIIVGVLACAGFGLLNGTLVTRIRLPAFIVTLGTLNIAFALTHIYSHEETIAPLPGSMTIFGNTFSLFGTDWTYGTVVLLGLFVIGWFALSQSASGRHVYAIGNNPEATRLTGIKTDRLLLGVYTTAGLVYGIAAWLLVGRTGAGDPSAGQTDNLDSITAVVLGGTSLFGGRGSVLGTLIGAMIVGVFRNGLQLMGVAAIYQILITGILVIIAVSVDRLTRRTSRQ